MADKQNIYDLASNVGGRLLDGIANMV